VAQSSNNASSDGSAPGANSRTGQTFTFIDAVLGDLRLANTDAAAKNYGVSLATDASFAFTDDIAGNPRAAQGASWDIGASEATEYLFTDNDHSSGEFDSGTKSNVVWNTTALELPQPAVAEKELANPDVFGFDMSDIKGIWHINEATLNDTNTSVADASGNGLTGTLSTDNGATNKATSGKLNGAANFDGDGDAITVAATGMIDDMPAMTLSAWVNPNSSGQGSWGVIMSKTSCSISTPCNGWGFGWSGNGDLRLRFYMDYSGGSDLIVRSSSLNVAAKSVWSHIVLTWDGSRYANGVKMYINGVEVSAYDMQISGIGSRVSDAGRNLKIGQGGWDSHDGTFDGAIDETIVFGRALSSTEVANLYQRSHEIFNNDSPATFTSRIFDSVDADAKWYDLIPKTPVPYGRALPVIGSELSNYSGGVNTSDLIGYWNFDSTNAIHNATEAPVYGGTTGTFVTNDGVSNKSRIGKFSGGVLFDGVNDYFNIADNAIYNFQFSTSKSWSFWVNPQDLSVSAYAIGVLSARQDNNNHFGIGIGSPSGNEHGPCTNCVVAYVHHSGTTNQLVTHSRTAVLKVGQYHMVTVTYDHTLAQASRFKIFVDGLDVTDTTDINSAGTLGTNTINPINVRLGGQPDFGEFVHAEMDEVAFWNKALSATEVANLYARGAARLKYQVRACDDASCIGESWRGYDNTTTSFFDESLNALKSVFAAVLPFNYDVNRYFQYRVTFESDNSNVTPKLEAVDVRAAD
jgi:hypothetical protein